MKIKMKIYMKIHVGNAKKNNFMEKMYMKMTTLQNKYFNFPQLEAARFS
jgi:hypothetical protein